MATPARGGARVPKATEMPAVGRALGLRVEAPAGFPGLRGAAGPGADRGVRLDLVADVEIERAWSGADADEEHLTTTRSSGSGALTAHHPAAGYLIGAPDGSRALVDADGHRIRVATVGNPPERWQGLVAAQALPLAATLQGLEIFKVSAVVVAGQVMAFAGPPGVGKSALAARLMLVGARFFADDLIALELCGQQILAHAGLGVMRLGGRGRPTLPQLTAQGADVIGRDGKTLVEMSRDVPTLPLRSLYLLNPVPEGVELAISADLPRPFRMLTATDSLTVRTPERMRRHFDLVASMHGRVGIFSAGVPRGAEHDLARAIFTHAALEVLL